MVEGGGNKAERRKKKIKGETIFALSTGLMCGFITGYLFTLATSLFNLRGPCSLLDFHPYNTEFLEENTNVQPADMFEYRTDSAVARSLLQSVKILCWIVTESKNHRLRALHIKRTWASRCDKYLFFTNVHDGELPTVVLEKNSGKYSYFNKTLEALRYLYLFHYHEAEWFLKADDTSYMILENLRYLLSLHKMKKPLQLGLKYKHERIIDGYIADKPGYVINKPALQRIAVILIPHVDEFLKNSITDLPVEVKLGLLFKSVGIELIDSRDYRGKERFHPFDPKSHVFEVSFPSNDSEKVNWDENRFYPSNTPGYVSGCSETAISFSQLSPAQMYMMEYVLYGLRPYGVLRY